MRHEWHPRSSPSIAAASCGRSHSNWSPQRRPLRRSGDTVTVALIAANPAALIPAVSLAGVDEIVTVQVAAAEFDPETIEAAMGALIEARRPAVVLVPHSIDAFGYAAAVAARSGYGFASDVFAVDTRATSLVATRGGYGQKVNIEVDFPGKPVVLLAVRGSVFKPPEGSGVAGRVEPARRLQSNRACAVSSSSSRRPATMST